MNFESHYNNIGARKYSNSDVRMRAEIAMHSLMKILLKS